MVVSSQPDRYLIRRRLSEATVAQSPRPNRDARPIVQPSAEPEPPRLDLEQDISQTITSIEHVVDNFRSLKDNFRLYEDLVEDLRAKLDEETAQREKMSRDLAGLERLVGVERDRAVKAEKEAEASEAVIRDLEEQLSSLRSQTVRLVKAVSTLISAERDSRADDGTNSNLRLVS